MGEYYLKVLVIMLVLFAFLVPGYILRKVKLLSAESLPTLSNILLYVCQPMMFIKAFCVNPVSPEKDVLINMLYVFLLSMAGLLLVFFLAKGVFCRVKDKKRANVYVFLTTFSNCGFIGIPFVELLTDGDTLAVMYVTLFNCAFNFLIWTLGVYLMTGNRSDVSFKRAFLNPSTLGMGIAFLLFLVPQANVFNMEQIAPVRQVAVYLGEMTAPLSMLIVGARAADLSFKDIFCNPADYAAAAMRLIVAPAVMFLVVLPLKLTGTIESTVYLAPVIAMAMTPASTVVAYAEKFDGDRKTAARTFLLGTLLGILTIPLVITLITL